MTFAGAILELKDNIQYIRKRTFIEIISLMKHHDITTLVLNLDSHLPKKIIICCSDSALKIMKNAFYFILNTRDI